LVSTHDLNLAATRFDLVLLINRQVISIGTAEQVLTQQHMAQAFGNSFLTIDDKVIIDECCAEHDRIHGEGDR